MNDAQQPSRIVSLSALSDVLEKLGPLDNVTLIVTQQQLLMFLRNEVQKRLEFDGPDSVSLLSWNAFNNWRTQSRAVYPLGRASFAKEVARLNRLFSKIKLEHKGPHGEPQTILFVGDKVGGKPLESYTPEFAPEAMKRAPTARVRDRFVRQVKMVGIDDQCIPERSRGEPELNAAEFERRVFRALISATFDQSFQTDAGRLHETLESFEDFHRMLEYFFSYCCPLVLETGELAYFAYILPVHVPPKHRKMLQRWDPKIQDFRMKLAVSSNRRGNLGQNFALANSSNTVLCCEAGWANPQSQIATATTYQPVPGGEAYYRAFPVSLPGLPHRPIAAIGISAEREHVDQQNRFRKQGHCLAVIIGCLAKLLIDQINAEYIRDKHESICRTALQKWNGEDSPEAKLSWYMSVGLKDPGEKDTTQKQAAMFCSLLADYFDCKFGYSIDEFAVCDPVHHKFANSKKEGNSEGNSGKEFEEFGGHTP